MATSSNVAIKEFFDHTSIRDLEDRLLQAPSLELRYPRHHALGVIDTKTAVRDLVEHYREFMSVLKANVSDFPIYGHQLSPPPLIDQVWREHILDTRGYRAFCHEKFGKTMHRNANGALHRNIHQRELKRAKTTFVYAKLLGEKRIGELLSAGLWWPTRSFEEPTDADDIAEAEETATEVSRKRRVEGHNEGPAARQKKRLGEDSSIKPSEDKATQTETEDQPVIIFIQLCTPYEAGMPISRMTHCELGASVHHMKTLLRAHCIPICADIDKFTLFFDGTRLDPAKTLRSYGVTKYAVLQVYKEQC
ncbi:hypothetical protein CYMTET_2509 [Cymbomonas tetramitiformis]|uniref:Ubiquitin-like domain-containing protein n=1 Tax=Cymbomonas tetramitiformis TaxID=36881 RepID=A0AAE0LLP6_9CHLO|nr:hypothetical protein CYMTET_2509 [Cymbomonas tetramitiformis]